MKTKHFRWTEPTSRTRAINQVVSCLLTIDNLNEKGAKILETLDSSKRKLENLQKHIDSLEESVKFSEENKDQIQKRIDFLKKEFTLTEAEILETKSKILREQIASLEAMNQTVISEGTIES